MKKDRREERNIVSPTKQEEEEEEVIDEEKETRKKKRRMQGKQKEESRREGMTLYPGERRVARKAAATSLPFTAEKGYRLTIESHYHYQRRKRRKDPYVCMKRGKHSRP
jgi:hypothetical protein